MATNLNFSGYTLVVFTILMVLTMDVFGQGNNSKKQKPQTPEDPLEHDGVIRTNHRRKRQNNTYVIEYDFKTKRYSVNAVSPWIHQPVVYKIKNINRLAYDVKITSKDSIIDFESTIPGIFFEKTDSIKKEEAKKIGEAVATPESIKLPATGTPNDKAAVEKSNKQISEVQSISDKIRLLKHEMVMLKDSTITMQISGLSSGISMESLNNNSNKGLEIIKHKIQEEQTKISTLETELTRLTTTLNSNKKAKELLKYNEILGDLTFDFDDTRITFNELWGIVQASERLNNMISDPFLSSTSISQRDALFLSECESKFVQNRNNIGVFYQKSEIFRRKLTNSLAKLNADKDFPDSLKLLLREYSTFLDERVKSMTEIVKNQNFKSLNLKIERVIKLLRNPETFEKTSAPIQPSADIVIFSITISNKDKNPDIENATTFTHREFVRGGLRYDFSAGLVFSVGVGNRRYSRVPVNDNEFRIIRQPSSNEYVPDIAGMFHASLRNTRTVTVGFTLGASINSKELSLNSIFPGLSLMVGKSEKFVFTVGPSLQRVSILSSEVNENTIYNNANLAVNTIPMEDAYKVGMFFGVSYNLTKKQRDSFTIRK